MLTVSRWTNYGKDRLYVRTAHGLTVGWLDLRTGHIDLQQPELAELFHAALAAHQAPEPIPAAVVPPGTPTAPDEPAPGHVAAAAPSTDPAWVDLAANRPGQAVREQAQAELAAMKDRTRVGSFLARALDVNTDERSWRVGANGEETIGARLDKLTHHGWHVLHSVPVGRRGSDIDHVLVGPGGVYTINTKNHPGKNVWISRHVIKVNGRTVPYLRNSLFEAERAQKTLTACVGRPIVVRPVLVFLTGTLIPNVTIKDQPDSVTVLDRTDIPNAFKRVPMRLTHDEIDEIYDQARRSTTWIN